MRWIWIDRILELERGSRCVAMKNVSLAEEHLHDHFPGSPVMPGPLIIEGMAQTAGILTGASRDFKEKVILAKIGKVELVADALPGHTLIYEAQLERIDEAGASTTGIVRRLEVGQAMCDAIQIGQIDLMFSHIDRNMKGSAFPEHNFVFTEQFMQLLERSGFATQANPEA